MLNNLLKVLTPDLILQAIRDNPKLVLEVLQKFDTFRLLGESLTPELQIVLSNNGRLVNEYLASADGKAAARLWAEGFAEFVTNTKRKQQELIDAQNAEKTKIALASTIIEEKHARDILEAKIRKDLEVKLRVEIEDKLRKELEEKKAVIAEK